jgi:hypothetical protein
METLASPRAYASSARAIAPAPYHRPRTKPWGPTSRTALHARHRYRLTLRRVLSGVPAAVSGPRTCRSTTPCPTMTSRPPTGRAAASQQGHVAGRASAHVGIRAIQDLIPSAHATNLWLLRVCSIGREARRRGCSRPKRGPLRRFPSPPCPASTSAATRWPSRPARRTSRGAASSYRPATMPIMTPSSAWARVR